MTGHPPDRPNLVIKQGLSDGAHQAIVAMHADYYSKAWRFGPFFKDKVAAELAEFLTRYDAAHDRLLLAVEGARIAGSLVVDGGEPQAATQGAHLRWFIIDDARHGRGIGKALMDEAMAFVRSAGFPRCYLTTFNGLHAARALYERSGFKLVREAPSQTWGMPVTEQLFEWLR